ncbi:ECF transporter S component [Virgibacillus sp. 179-BFC.A HS]|uniref:ECF transporter S component n=1 Tax=Tigheibacillus jepli TaxID=3035914 RepID=A0ABU5CIM8_9BACI|nr:ECF transporter S component [Virgibacillus sp. 179-BFC.A HS]MDY0405674.1 ECF transporter S component [Virgibacillus sp. 179-BFC.A HS]
MNVYKLTLLAIFAALGVAGRLVLVYVPNVQPASALIIVCGLMLGPLSAVILAFLIAFLSNMLLGVGIWTIWQIFAWSLIGLISGWIGKYPRKIPLIIMMLFGIFCGYFYGFVISLTSYQITGQFFLAYYLAGLPYDTYHAIGNAVFILLLYPILQRFTKKYAKHRFPIQDTNMNKE